MEYISKNKRWIINKIGLVNFWLYDDEEFEFYDGRLLLRGSNGSGKTVTMQSFIPFLLDGNRSPERLDPFGSKAKKIDTYLLGENYELEENTGYLYMELYKASEDKYLTIGIGLRARKHKQIQFWGFSLHNRRIGKDFHLYKPGINKILLTKKELKNRLSEADIFVDSQQEYMKMVNDLVFGFENLGIYKEFISLQLELRNPQLVDKAKPTEIAKSLTKVLEELSDDDLRPMSDSIENMNKAKENLDQLKQVNRALSNFIRSYNRYNLHCLLIKAYKLTTASSELKEAKKQLINNEATLNDYINQEHQYNTQLQELETELVKYQEKEKRLSALGLTDLLQELKDIEDKIASLSSTINKKQTELNDKQTKKNEFINKQNTINEEINLVTNNINNLLVTLNSLSKEFNFDEFQFFNYEFNNQLTEEYDFSLHLKELDNHQDKINHIKHLVENFNRENDKYNQLESEHDKVEDSIRNIHKQLDEKQLELMNEKDTLIESFYEHEDNNQVFKIENHDSVINYINNIETHEDINIYKSYLTELNNQLKDNINIELNKQKVSIELVKKQIVEKEIEIEQLENEPELVINKSDETINSRKMLEANNIPFISLNQAIDFKQEIDEGTKNNIEASLLDMGILDALIVPNQYQEIVNHLDTNLQDKYIFVDDNDNGYSTFSSYFNIIVTEHVKHNHILNALNQIGINEEDKLFYIDIHGNYKIGFISGKTSNTYASKYIGEEARKRYKQALLKTMYTELSKLNTDFNNIQTIINQLNSDLITLASELEPMLNTSNIYTIIETTTSLNHELAFANNKLDDLRDQLTDLDNKLQAIREEIKTNNKHLNISTDINAINTVLNHVNSYRHHFSDVKVEHGKYLNKLTSLKMINENIENSNHDITNLNDDISETNLELAKFQAKRVATNEILNRDEYANVKDELYECQDKLNKLPKQIRTIELALARLSETITHQNDAITNTKKTVAKNQELYDVYQTIFIDEYQLKYVFSNDLETKNIVSYCKKLLKDNETSNLDARAEVSQLSIIDPFQRYQNDFNEYSPQLENILTYDTIDINNNYYSIYQAAKRTDVIARYNGQLINIIDLNTQIIKNIDDLDNNIREDDRRLFESILFDTVGQKIRELIYKSEAWVKKVNTLMENMETSMGLTFSIDWRPKLAIAEEEMNTKELVSLLKADTNTLKDSDVSRLAEHFRSKVKYAELQLATDNNGNNFNSIIKTVLDYRQWFEFRLRYQRGDNVKKELTNNTIGTFSGGEKALAIYIPMFSAIYAKYYSAREEALRVIAIDEIFARVDNTNIAMMFKLLTDLEIDYVGTSQALWGDYATIPHLSICEIRKQNDIVMVARYRWNGKYRQLVDKEIN